MALVFTGAGTAANTTSSTSVTVTTTTAFAVGELLFVYMAYDNSGGGGADPMSAGPTVSPATGALGAFVTAPQGLNDPGSASAGLASKTIVFPVTTAIPTSTVITISWTGSVVGKAVVLGKVSSSYGVTGASVAWKALVTSQNSVGNQTTMALGFTPAAVGDMIVCYAGFEYSGGITGDSDSVSGTWASIYGVANAGATFAGMSAALQAKTFTATTGLGWDPTATSGVGSDWIVGGVTFSETVFPTMTQDRYRFYADDGPEPTNTALGTENTAYTTDVSDGDLNLSLRFRVQNSSVAALPYTGRWRLQYAKNGGAWTNVTSDPLEPYFIGPNLPWNGTDLGQTTTLEIGQSFTGNGLPFARAAFWMQRTGTPTGNIRAAIRAHSGTFGTSSVATGTPLATSTARPVTDVPTATNQWVEFTFDETFTPTNGTNYVLTVGADTATYVDASNKLQIWTTNSGLGNLTTRTGTSTWTFGGDLGYIGYTRAASPPTDPVIAYNSANLNSYEWSTQRLTAGTGTFASGRQAEDGEICPGQAAGTFVNASNHTEFVYSLRLQKNYLANGDALTFRMLYNGATSQMTYTATPTLNVTKTDVAVTQAAYRFYADGTETGSTALGTQSTAYTADVSSGDVNLALRMRLQSTSIALVPAACDWQLQWQKNASGTWVNVSALAGGYPVANEATGAAVGSTAIPRRGQSFLGNGANLTRAGFHLTTKLGSPTGTVTAYLYAHTGTYGTTGVPTGTALATSTTTVDIGSQTAPVWMYFDFAGTYTLVDGTPYFIAISADTPSASNYFFVGNDTLSPTHPGNAASYNGTTWSVLSGDDLIFEVYTSNAVIEYASANLTDGAATTNRLGSGSGSFVAGEISETGLVTDLGWSANNFTEVLYPITLKQANLANADALTFRVLKDAGTALMTYTATPTLNVTKTTAVPITVPVMGPRTPA